jgi:aryl-alcohol dehydrogenase-like predicted oxidoreductase
MKIGLGCVTFGREIDKAASFTIMDYAVANGINFFDTASAYGNGASEEIVGEWLAARKSKIVVATKILPPYDRSTISKSVDECRRRLRIDTIDLLFLHSWHEDVLTDETLSALDDVIKSGAAKELGASNFSPEQLDKAAALQKIFCFAQNNNNYAVREFNDQFQQICERHKVDMVSYSPLGAGFLTGKHTNGVISGSRFEVAPAHQKIYFTEEAQSRLQHLQSVAEKTSYTSAQLALAWAFHQPVAKVLCGARTIDHIDQALAAMRLNDEEAMQLLGKY